MKCTNPELGKFALLSDRKPDERLPESVREHLAVCPECAARRERYDTWLNLLKSESRSQHLETEILLAYDDGLLSSEERLRADAHLRSCQKCSNELDWIKSAFDGLEKDELDISHSVSGWTKGREQAFVANMKRELQARGQLLTEESMAKAAAIAQSIPTSPRPRFPALWWRLGLGFAVLVLAVLMVAIIGKIISSFSTPKLHTKETKESNQNLTVQTSPSSPSPTASASGNDNQAVQQRVRPPGNKTINESYPAPPKQADLETQVIAMVIDPSRAPGQRQAIFVSQPNLRFLISIPRSAVSRSFRFEMIDEDKGTKVNGPKLVTARPKADRREVMVELPATELSSSLYTLRLTGRNKPDEVFTLYLKLDK